MKKLLILPNLHTVDDNDIWRAGIRNGWHVERCDRRKLQVPDIASYDTIRYYGNYLHQAKIFDQMPQRFFPLPNELLAASHSWTRRSVRLMRFRDLPQPLDRTAFIKPCRDKWFPAGIFHADSLLPGTPLPDDSIYVQDPVVFTDEIRCFTLDGDLRTAGHYILDDRKYGSVVEDEVRERDAKLLIDPELQTMIAQIAKTFRGHLPLGIVMDFGRRPDGHWSLIEFNEAWCSGLYYCDPVKCLEVIVASQEDLPCEAPANR